MALWDKIGGSGNVEDRRGQRSGLAFGGGLGGIILIAAFVLLSGGSTTDVLEAILGQASQQQQSQQSDQPFEDPNNYQTFAAKVLGSTDEAMTNAFQSIGKEYSTPKLVLFRGITQTGCGTADSSIGPFYCPIDQTIYLDETFFDQIRSQLDATTSGDDVAQAYVIAHEAGHHAQNLLGALDAASDDPAESVKTELQADCYAGVWAHSARTQGIFENDSEINEALGLASAIGDDRIQAKTEGQVNPETWTHGSSEQRMTWFKKGYASGSLDSCQMF